MIRNEDNLYLNYKGYLIEVRWLLFATGKEVFHLRRCDIHAYKPFSGDSYGPHDDDYRAFAWVWACAESSEFTYDIRYGSRNKRYGKCSLDARRLRYVMDDLIELYAKDLINEVEV